MTSAPWAPSRRIPTCSTGSRRSSSATAGRSSGCTGASCSRTPIGWQASPNPRPSVPAGNGSCRMDIRTAGSEAESVRRCSPRDASTRRCTRPRRRHIDGLHGGPRPAIAAPDPLDGAAGGPSTRSARNFPAMLWRSTSPSPPAWAGGANLAACCPPEPPGAAQRPVRARPAETWAARCRRPGFAEKRLDSSILRRSAVADRA